MKKKKSVGRPALGDKKEVPVSIRFPRLLLAKIKASHKSFKKWALDRAAAEFH